MAPEEWGDRTERIVFLGRNPLGDRNPRKGVGVLVIVFENPAPFPTVILVEGFRIMQRLFPRFGAAVSAALAGILISLSACNPAPMAPSAAAVSKPHAGKVLMIAVADPLLAAEVRGRAKAWANRSGAAVTVVDGSAPDADIAIVSQEGIAGPASRGELASVPEAITGNGKSFRWDTLFVPFQTSLVQWGTSIVAVPVAGDGLVCVYRADRFREPLASKAFREKFGKDLVPPRTWEDIAEIAAVFQQPGRPSLAPLPSDRTVALAQFFQLAACYDRAPAATGTKDGSAARALSFLIDLDGGKLEPRLNAPAFAAAYAWFAATAPYRPATAGDPVVAIGTGSAVVALLTLRELAALPRDPKTGAISEAFGMVAVPGTRTFFDAEGKVQEAAGGRNAIPFLGGAGAFGIVSKKSASTEAAWDFLSDLAGPDGSASTLSESGIGAGPTRESHLSAQTGGAIWQRYGFDKARTDELGAAMQSYANTGVANPALPLRTPDAGEVFAILDAQLRRAASGQATGPDAAKAAIRDWAAHDAKQNPEQLKDRRRKAAGLE